MTLYTSNSDINELVWEKIEDLLIKSAYNKINYNAEASFWFHVTEKIELVIYVNVEDKILNKLIKYSF